MSDFGSVKVEFEGALLDSPWYPACSDKQPAILILPTVMGVTELELNFARKIGYGSMVGDLFGVETRGASRETMFAHMARLKEDRAALLRRLVALLDAMRAQPEVDPTRVAVIGFCFGGLCALDLARSGADLVAAASFHGLFDPPGLPPQPIKARVAAYHGWDDPLVPPAAVTALATELTAAGCDWQIHAYGHTGHGFTNPAATGAMPGVAYEAKAARRSWESLRQLLGEAFG